MRFESLFWAGMIAVAALGLPRTESGEAAAQTTAGRTAAQTVETYKATAVELRSLSGELRIESGNVDRIEVVFEGASADLAKVDRRVEADTLVVDGRDLGDATLSSSVVVQDLSVTVTGGGTSQVTIGGASFDAARRDAISRADVPLRTMLRLPRNLSVKILGHRGDVVSGDLTGPLVLDLIAGEARLGQIRNAQLSLTGAGSISAREALGTLTVAVTGDGKVDISESLLERLEVGVTGEGAVAIDGQARFASLSLVGPGRIYLAAAERQPVINRIGHGEIVIGQAR